MPSSASNNREKSEQPPGWEQRKPTPLSPQTSSNGPAAPDGGWGWVVVFASFMIHVVTDGVVYSFGELYKIFLVKFNEGNGKTSWIASILIGTTLCAGPIASALVVKFGCRLVTIAGSVIACVSILTSIYAADINVLILTMGFGTGVGFGLIYLPAIVSVTSYFEKYRSVATGIGVCGSGFGTILFSPLISTCNKNFGVEGTLVIIAALVLTCVFYGALFRPLPDGDGDVVNGEVRVTEAIPLTMVTRAEEDDVLGSPLLSSPRAEEKKLKASRGTPSSAFSVSSPALTVGSVTSLRSNHSGIMRKPDIFYTGSISNLKEASKSNGNLHVVHRALPDLDFTENDDKNAGCSPCGGECKETVKEMLDFSILLDPIFVMFVVSNFLTSIGYNIPYLYIPVQVKEKGLSEESSSFLLSCVGAGNMAGRIILGYVADKPQFNRLIIYNTCLTICGIATMASVFCSSLYACTAYALVFGFTTGAYVGLTSVITVDLFGMDKLTNAFGIVLLFQGIASLVGPPAAGLLCDWRNSYDPGFHLAGFAIGISGLMLYVVPNVQNYLRKRATSNPPVNGGVNA